MASNKPRSPSLRVSRRVSPQAYAGHPITPVHSPHHSIASSTKSWTPVHTLTIHEYRKQQNSPMAKEQITPSKKLRRKAATAALIDVGHVPSIANASSPSFDLPLRPSQSVCQFYSSQAPQPQHALQTQRVSLPQHHLPRARPAELHIQTDGLSNVSTVTSIDKVRYFNTRKRLPKPPAATGPPSFPPPKNRQTPRLQRSQLSSGLSFSSEKACLSEAQSTPTRSSFSLSQFPNPPHRLDPLFSLLQNEEELARVNTLRFSTSAPATPPATPAVLHYHGASFDLLNPHDSLLLHGIVTPSQDFESDEYPLLQTSEDWFLESAEMAPKRALYGDINSARAGIMRRPEDALHEPNLNLPLPPTPAAVSPSSSSCTSPSHDPGSVDVPLPLAFKKTAGDSRFSLKQLTRSLTKKIGKSSQDKSNEVELDQISSGFTPVSQEEEDPWSTAYSDVAVPQASYFPPGLSLPLSSSSPTVYRAFGVEYSAMSPVDGEAGKFPRQTQDSQGEEPLAPLVPDELSSQIGRMNSSQASNQEENTSSKPYYDDLDSIYPSSSVYSVDGKRQSYYQDSLTSARLSKQYPRLSGYYSGELSTEYNRDSVVAGHSIRMQSFEDSGLFYHSIDEGDPKTDTISKLIDGYNPADLTSSPSQIKLEQPTDSVRDSMAQLSAFDRDSITQSQHVKEMRQDGRCKFDSHPDGNYLGSDVIQLGSVQARQPTVMRDAGLPPNGALPSVPAFEYDEAPFVTPHLELSDMLSNDSAHSYGDTRALLQMNPSDAGSQHLPRQRLDPSSSYSQPEVRMLEPSSSYSQKTSQSPQPPENSLDEASKVLHNRVLEHGSREEVIPAMWARRSSGTQLLSKGTLNRFSGSSKEACAKPFRYSKDLATERAEWETIGGNSQGGRDSLDSIADYSSSENSRATLEIETGNSLQPWQLNCSSGSPHYGRQSPLGDNRTSRFISSPPGIKAPLSPHTEPTLQNSGSSTGNPGSKTVPLFRFGSLSGEMRGRGAVEEPYAHAPWTTPYALSDKETQELLASGPNDEILVDTEAGSPELQSSTDHQCYDHDVSAASSSLDRSLRDHITMERENTFQKLSFVGPLGNLTGTPHGTGMHHTGSSVADNSSPGLRLSSMVGRNNARSQRTEYPGFYATSSPALSSVTRIEQPRRPQMAEVERWPSQMTLFPKGDEVEPVEETPSSPLPTQNRRHVLRSSTKLISSRRLSRSAVPGQTKLRQMRLVGDSGATISSQDTTFSRLRSGISDRPSTSDSITPLYPTHHRTEDFAYVNRRAMIAQQHSPHLLCPEKEANEEDEARRCKLSWAIFAAFCLLPPCIMLFRFLGDGIIASITEGRLGYTTAKSKRTAVIAGVAVNVVLITVVLIPVMVAHAMKTI